MAQFNSHASHHCDVGSIPAPCSNLIEVTLVTFERNDVQFDCTKHRRFSPGTPVSFCGNTGLMLLLSTSIQCPSTSWTQ